MFKPRNLDGRDEQYKKMVKDKLSVFKDLDCWKVYEKISVDSDGQGNDNTYVYLNGMVDMYCIPAHITRYNEKNGIDLNYDVIDKQVTKIQDTLDDLLKFPNDDDDAFYGSENILSVVDGELELTMSMGVIVWEHKEIKI